MPFVSLKFPPGVVRPGTTYQAKGRWFQASLVRWFENAMQPIGGWQALEFRSANVAAAISEDGGAFTDETADANEDTADDVVLVPATPAEDDAFYIGLGFRFTEVEVNVTTAAADGVVQWQYWNGSNWVTLPSVQDNTVNFTVAGLNSVLFGLRDDWTARTVNSQGPFFYIRARVAVAGTTTALAGRVRIGTGPVAVDEPVRGMIAWRANDDTAELAFGTPTTLYQYAEGVLTDVTPSGFTTGGADAVLLTGDYGQGPYGAGLYGTADESDETIIEANTWQLDTFGEDLIAWAYSDGALYQWDKSAGGVAAVLTNAPTDNAGVVVTPERFVVALGADGDGRLVQWADQESLTDWTPTATNQAGDFPLSTVGQLLAGRRGRGETLLWTTTDLWAMRYIGGTLVYSFQQLGSGCGAISRRSMAVVDGRAIWMGTRSFFAYDGFVQPLPSDVGDFVFGDLNRTQASKIWCDVRSEFSEVWWFYPSAASTEIDRYVAVNVNRGFWLAGELERTAGVDRGAFSRPIMADASGALYRHETGESYLDPDGVALVPDAESGPFELGNGERVMHVLQYIPDEATLGDVQLSLIGAPYPTATETTHGPFTAANPTSVRLTARQVRMKIEQVNAGWRFGIPRLDVKPGGLR